MNNTFCIDYLSLTLKAPQGITNGKCKIEWFIDKLTNCTNGNITSDNFEFFNYGLYVYEYSAKFQSDNKFIILSSDDDKQGNTIMLQISGIGLKHISTFDLQNIVSWCYSYGCSCSRIDLAYDDYTKSIPIHKMHKSFKQYIGGMDIIESHFKRDTVTFYEGIFDNITYKNITFGSRKSSQYMRLYDKRAEQGQQGIEVPDYWYRLEIECRKICAQSVFDYIIKNSFDIENAFKLYLNRMFRILSYVPSDLKNKSRVDTAEYWLKFIKTDLKGEILKSGADFSNDYDRMLNHFKNNYSGVLYTINTISPAIIQSILSTQGQEQALKPKYLSLINHYCNTDDLEF